MGKKTYRLFKKMDVKSKWQLMKVANYENMNQAREQMMATVNEMENIDGRVYENKNGEQFYISEE